MMPTMSTQNAQAIGGMKSNKIQKMSSSVVQNSVPNFVSVQSLVDRSFEINFAFGYNFEIEPEKNIMKKIKKFKVKKASKECAICYEGFN